MVFPIAPWLPLEVWLLLRLLISVGGVRGNDLEGLLVQDSALCLCLCTSIFPQYPNLVEEQGVPIENRQSVKKYQFMVLDISSEVYLDDRREAMGHILLS